MKRLAVGLWKLSLLWLALLPLSAKAAEGPPVIQLEPVDQSVRSGSNVVFNVIVDGTEPLIYQWRLNSNTVPGGTTANLTLNNVRFTNGGNYQLFVNNSLGAATSRVAFLEVDAHLTFRVLELRTNNLVVIDEQPLTGYPKAGVVTSSNYVVAVGSGTSGYESVSARHNLATLGSGTRLSGNCDAVACNLRSGKLYVLANGSSPITYLDYNLNFSSVNALLEINEVNGVPVGAPIPLSLSIPINDYGYVGIFSGYDRLVVQGGSGGYHMYDIALPSGQVTDLGVMSIPSRTGTYSWAYWGIAEYVNNALSVIYVQNSTTIVRRRVPNNIISVLATFANLNNTASLGFSLSASRWYFLIPYSSQFSTFTSTLGTAKAIYTTDPDYPLITVPPAGQKVYATSNATLSATAIGAQPLVFQWLFNSSAIPDATNATLLLTNVQASDGGYYSMQAANPVGMVTSPQAFLDVVTSPRVLSVSAGRSVMQGTNTFISVNVDGAPPISMQWILNGTNLPPWANSSSLNLTNIQATQAGFYALFSSNRYGILLSPTIEVVVMAPVDDGSIFQITSLQTNNFRVIDSYNLWYDYEYGSLAASSNQVFFSSWYGYDSARANINDLSGLATVGRYYFALLSNLRTEKAYCLGNSDGVPQSTTVGTATHLWEIDGQTGDLTGGSAVLSQSIPNIRGSSAVGFFSGYDRAIVLNGTRAYTIALPSGVVTDLGPMGTLSHASSYSGSFWGVAERFGGVDYIVYCRDSTSMARTRVPDGAVFYPFAPFSNLSSYMSSITASIRRDRWYFLHRNSSQFAPSGRSMTGYADATFNIYSGANLDHFDWVPVASPQLSGTPFPVILYAKNSSNLVIASFTGRAYLSGIAVPSGGAISITPSLTPNFVNGSWTGMVTVLQATTNMALLADDHDGHLGRSENFRVIPRNDLGLTMSAAPNPVVVGQLLTYSIRVTNSGPSAATGVMLTNPLTSTLNFISAASSQGSCSNASGTVLCNLGAVSNVVAVSIVVQPTRTGVILSRVTLGRNEVDPDPANNSVTVISSVVLPILTVQDANLPEGNSGTNPITFTVTLNPPATNTVSVNYSTGNGTAFSSGAYPDFVAASGTLIFTPGSTSQTFTVGIRGDLVCELDETFVVNMTSPTNGYVGRPQATGTILNDDTPPTINLSDASVPEGDSGTNNAIFTVTLSTMSGAEVTFGYATSNGTATAGSDYLARSGALNFAAETTNLVRSISVPVLGDTTVEPTERFYVVLTGITNAVAGKVDGLGAIIHDDGIGVLDHFTWDAIPSPQAPGAPFAVTLAAKDLFEGTITNFNVSVTLSAAIPGYAQRNIFGDVQNILAFTNGLFTIGFEFTPTNDFLVTDFRHISGAKVSLWTAAGDLLASKDVVSAPGTWVTTPLDAPAPLTAGATYRLSFCGGNEQIYFYSLSIATNFPNGSLGAGYWIDSDDFPTNAWGAGIYYYLVDLVYTTPEGTQPIGMVPTNTRDFTNGVWAGSVSIQDAATNVILMADDGAQHFGHSNPFDVGGEIYFTYARVNGADLQMGFHGLPGPTYRLERNDQLTSTNWIQVIDFRIGSRNDIDLFDSIRTNTPAQFYRIREVPAP